MRLERGAEGLYARPGPLQLSAAAREFARAELYHDRGGSAHQRLEIDVGMAADDLAGEIGQAAAQLFRLALVLPDHRRDDDEALRVGLVRRAGGRRGGTT